MDAVLVAIGLAIAGLLAGCSSSKESYGVTKLPQRVGFAASAALAADFKAELPRLATLSISSSDELWVIARGTDGAVRPVDENPGTGTLLARVQQKQIPMPLKHTDVHASVSGFIGSVEVSQQFQNPYSSKIEAVYVFPLPHNAAVNEFIMTIGERKIRALFASAGRRNRFIRKPNVRAMSLLCSPRKGRTYLPSRSRILSRAKKSM